MKLFVLVLVLCSVFAVGQTQPTSATPESAAPVQLEPQAAAVLAEKKVSPVYPEKARSNGIQGTVVLNVLISGTGDVKEASVVTGDPDLGQAAIDAIRQWKYKPYMVNGKANPIKSQVTFDFHIQAPPLPPPVGSFRNGKYQNDFFGIAYPLSTEWVRETTLVRARAAEGNKGPSSSQVLLAALHVPSKSDGLVADSSIVLIATPQPGLTEAREYLDGLTKALRAEKLAKPRGEVTSIVIAGATGYRADFKPSAVGAQYESIVCALNKGHILRWSFFAASESSLDDAVATLSAISNLDPVAGGDKPPASNASAAAAPASVDFVRVSSGVTTGLLVKKVEPRYPPDAKSAHIQGRVILHACIDKEGNVIDLEALSGPVELVPSTVAAVRQWKYRPYLLKGEPIELDTTVEVRYTLGG